jgi:putative sterol carrier protein
MTYEKIFADVKKSLMKADVSKIEQEFAIQCNIQGEGEGSFYISFKEGIFSVEPYDYKGCDAHLHASGDTFMKMFAKKIDGKEAFEQGLLGFDGDIDVVLSLGSLQPKKVVADKKKTPAKKNASKK